MYTDPGVGVHRPRWCVPSNYIFSFVLFTVTHMFTYDLHIHAKTMDYCKSSGVYTSRNSYSRRFTIIWQGRTPRIFVLFQILIASLVLAIKHYLQGFSRPLVPMLLPAGGSTDFLVTLAHDVPKKRRRRPTF